LLRTYPKIPGARTLVRFRSGRLKPALRFSDRYLMEEVNHG
jgi:hypothetical protein